MMERLDLLQKAKMYIDKLANGINPLTDDFLAEEDIANNVKIARCLFYVSSILDEVIQAGGKVKKGRRPKKTPFSITDEQLQCFPYTDEPKTLSQIVREINALVDENVMKKLSYSLVRDTLLEMGILELANGRYEGAKYCPSELGESIGVFMDRRSAARGVYFVVAYRKQAQEFIINHVQQFS